MAQKSSKTPLKRTLKNVYAVTRTNDRVEIVQNIAADSINEAIEYVQFEWSWMTVTKAEVVMKGVRA